MLKITNSTKTATGNGEQLMHKKSQEGALADQLIQLFHYH
jgi:hypothetical protein